MIRKANKLIRILRMAEGRRGVLCGVGAAIEHEAFLRSCAFATVLDAGANKGQFSLATLCVRPDAEIIAFEPLSAPAKLFEKLFAGRANVSLYRLALGAGNAKMPIHISQRDDSSSLLPISGVQTSTFPGTDEVATAEIDVAPLDEVLDVSALRGPVLLKIDVQGFELELLRGAIKSLPAINDIYCELSFLPLYAGQPLAPQVIEWLFARGFVLAGVYHVAKARDGRAVQADFHFRRA